MTDWDVPTTDRWTMLAQNKHADPLDAICASASAKLASINNLSAGNLSTTPIQLVIESRGSLEENQSSSLKAPPAKNNPTFPLQSTKTAQPHARSSTGSKPAASKTAAVAAAASAYTVTKDVCRGTAIESETKSPLRGPSSVMPESGEVASINKQTHKQHEVAALNKEEHKIHKKRPDSMIPAPASVEVLTSQRERDDRANQLDGKVKLEMLTASEIRMWLKHIGLGVFDKAFKAGDVDGGMLSKVDEDDLQQLGVGTQKQQAILAKQVVIALRSGIEKEMLYSSSDFVRHDSLIPLDHKSVPGAHEHHFEKTGNSRVLPPM